MAIVAAVDRSKKAGKVVQEAKILGEAFDDDVHVIHVLSRSSFVELERTSVEERGTPVDMDRVRNIAREIASEAAEGVGGSVETVGLMGDASERILEYADEHDARYVVVGTRKRSPTGKAVFGSVSQSVLLNSDVPVVAAPL